ncbi:hypothetical protein ZPAH1_orf00234 [Aeromonas phage ZPAH1]|nr:hypothetical protein ASwh1_185 [Aeromonas phage Aswh_1]QQG33996.1 hypothetical protein ZPAH1_orf00234 [Aeromonas phage ZPAH1]
MNYGHWTTDEKFDPRDILGFVYMIYFSNGKKYIGAKRVWKNLKRPPATYKRQGKTEFIESDWRSYRSSSNEVVELEAAGIEITEMRILATYDSWGKVLLCEAMLQFSLNALSSDTYLNKQIEGLFTSACFDKKVYNDVARCVAIEQYDPTTPQVIVYRGGDRSIICDKPTAKEYIRSGWSVASLPSTYQRKSYPMIPYTIKCKDTGEEITICDFKKQYEVAKKLECPAGDLSRLRAGEILNIGTFTMKDVRSPQMWEKDGQFYYNAADLKNAGVDKKDCIHHPAEDREAYRIRLALAV